MVRHVLRKNSFAWSHEFTWRITIVRADYCINIKKLVHEFLIVLCLLIFLTSPELLLY